MTPPPDIPCDIPPARPVLIAGPTASGKSALALALARRDGGVILNADAMQVYDGLRVLTARPSPADLALAPHALYGHVGALEAHSVGDWLRAVAPYLAGPQRPIVVGGTGLYFRALTEGLAPIPPVAPGIRTAAAARGHAGQLADLRAEDPATLAGIDTRNPARVQRAWEVLRATGRGLSDWQGDTPPPLLPRAGAAAFVAQVPPDVLAARIARRFDAMLDAGALEEVRALLPVWDRAGGIRKAIGAAQLVAHLRGETSLEAAREAAIVATRQFAKRQRTWFRARMGDWQDVSPDAGAG